MPWALARSETLRNVMAKLNRVDQLLDHLNEQTEAFLKGPPERILVDYDAESEAAFRAAHEGRAVEASMSILAGEVLYHLRSNLDHIVCGLIRKDGNQPTIQSQFPIFNYQPKKKEDVRRYDSQVKGITSKNALGIIEAFQPYKTDQDEIIRRSATQLEILKALSNYDKHQSVALHVVSVAKRKMVTVQTDSGHVIHFRGSEDDDLARGLPSSGEQRYLEAYVAFDDFGGHRRWEVVDGLRLLTGAFYPIIGELWGELV